MIEIIPKPPTEESLGQRIFFSFSLILVILVVVVFLILGYFHQKFSAELRDLETALAQEKTAQERRQELKILEIQKKLRDFSLLLENHRKTSNIFKLLEKLSHPQVWFFKFGFDSKNSQLSLSGQTENFQNLDQQLKIFQQDPMIKEINLAEISIGKDGMINFQILLSLDPEIFKESYQLETQTPPLTES